MLWAPASSIGARSPEAPPPHALTPGGAPGWAGGDSPDALRALLVPYPREYMLVWRVSKEVGSVRNDRPDLIGVVDSGPAINPG